MAQGMLEKGTANRQWCMRAGLWLLVAGLLLAEVKAEPPRPVMACSPDHPTTADHAATVPPTPYLPPAAGGTACPPEAPAVPTPERGPRPPTGPASLAAFIDDVSSRDSAIDVITGEGRVITTRTDIAQRGKFGLVAVGDPTVRNFKIINSRQIRITGERIGVTDLSITTSDNQTYTIEVRVVADLVPLRAKLCALFPDACLKLTQIRDHIAVEGEARDSAQVAHIIETIRAYFRSIEVSQNRKITGQAAGGPGGPPVPGPVGEEVPAPGVIEPKGPLVPIAGQIVPPLMTQAGLVTPQIINLIRVPSSQQVLLKVKVAELNRTAMRQMGTDFLLTNPREGIAIGSQIGGALVSASANSAAGVLTGVTQTAASPATTLFGIFDKGDFAIFFSALRKNSLLKILAEPNLVAMNGQQASFLAGGEFPVPVPQTGGGGISPTITVLFKEFGVKLGFIPTILDGDVIRLVVDPEVSSIDRALGTTLVPGGSPVPGLDTRKAHAVVQLHEGQTLAIAGLLQLNVNATTNRIPFLGDLPLIGPLFAGSMTDREETELLILVTPYLIEPQNGSVPPLPGDEVGDPTDLEFYLANRIESPTGRDHRATVGYDIQVPLLQALFRLDHHYVRGPVGYCD
jgi:pilus assembly protein CpaC